MVMRYMRGDYLDTYREYAPLVLRVITGFIFFMHGWQKLTTMGLEGVTGFLGTLGFPLPGLFAIILLTTEIIGGLMLIAGFYTRTAAELTAIVAFMAVLTVHISRGFSVSNGGYEFALLLGTAALALAFLGGGKWSVDHAIRK